MGIMKKKIQDFYFVSKQFGLKFSVKYYFYKITKNNDGYIKLVSEYLERYLQPLINKYNTFEKESFLVEENRIIPIWVCWFQGEENMPEVCNLCNNRLRKMLPKNAEIKFITMDNYKEYVKFPGFIEMKLINGSISYTHFSDILRWKLLKKHGGFWIDSTIFTANEINESFIENSSFWSVKLENVYDLKSKGQLISQCNWGGFILKDEGQSLLVDFMLESLMLYWEKHNVIIDYFLCNLIIKVACENILTINDTICNIEISNPKLYDLHHLMNEKFDEGKFKDIIKETTFFKLTWKTNYIKTTKNGEETFYGYLIRNFGK